MLARITIAFASLAAVAAGDCTTASYGSCGSDTAGVNCCPTGQYCQPWSASYYQCINVPDKCTEQYPDIDFYGDDLATLYGLQPGECCTRCTETFGCMAYTFVNSNPGQTACYLKSGTGTKTTSVGAVSGVVTTSTNSTPTPTATSNADDYFHSDANSRQHLLPAPRQVTGPAAPAPEQLAAQAATIANRGAIAITSASSRHRIARRS